MLESIRSPEDLKALDEGQRQTLAQEIREAIIQTVSQRGGHLASNLGVVELTMALHLAMDLPKDQLVFDVGHQSYAHKLLTGRQEAFRGLRSDEGLSGFPKRSESVFDCFETGHASTAISAAVGMARARDLRGGKEKVVALVGDGAMTGGMCYEAFNDAGSRSTQLLVVLNDNEMSIARNVGALAQHLTRLRASRSWLGTKKAVKEGVERIPLLGHPLSKALDWAKAKLRRAVVPGAFFESLGFRYLGPVDGHALEPLRQVIRNALDSDLPTVLHVITQKGKGFTPAEDHPELYHGVAPFFVEGAQGNGAGQITCADIVGETLAQMAAKDPRVVAISAAMPQGTGLDRFQTAHPDRFFDVGIAEEHAVTLAAGMAARGLRPYFGVYASFLQRSYDQLVHDVCIQNLPVTILADRAGFVSGDGVTHQGIFDICFLRSIPNLVIWSPSDGRELARMLRASLGLEIPCVIRYPKALPQALGEEPTEGQPVGKWRWLQQGKDLALLAFGSMLGVALESAQLLEAQGISAGVICAASLKPLDGDMLRALDAQGLRLVTLEEQQLRGGFGSAVTEHCLTQELRPPWRQFGVEDCFVQEHSIGALRKAHGLTAPQITQSILQSQREGV